MKILIIILTSLLSIVPGGKAYLRQLQQRDSILIADQIEYGFRLDSVKAGTKLGLPVIDDAQKNDTLVIVRGWQLDTTKTFSRGKGESKTTYYNIDGNMVFAPFEEGHYFLPKLALQRMLEGGSVDTLIFDALEMDVKTIPVDTATYVLHDIKGQIKYPLTAKEIFPWALAFLGLIGLVILVVRLVKRYKSRNNGEISAHKDPAYIVALRQLDKYRGDKYWAPEKQKLYYSGITDTLKAYIEDRFGIDAPEMTTSELFAALKDDKSLPKELYDEVNNLFVIADFVKFAKHTVGEEDNAWALPTAVRFVTSTYQKELEEEQDKNNVL